MNEKVIGMMRFSEGIQCSVPDGNVSVTILSTFNINVTRNVLNSSR